MKFGEYTSLFEIDVKKIKDDPTNTKLGYVFYCTKILNEAPDMQSMLDVLGVE